MMSAVLMVFTALAFKFLLTCLPNLVLTPSVNLEAVAIMRFEAALVAVESFLFCVNQSIMRLYTVCTRDVDREAGPRINPTRPVGTGRPV